MERALVLVSGGLKSAVLVASQRERFELVLLHINTGSRAAKVEQTAFERLCEEWKLHDHAIFSLGNFAEVSSHPLFNAGAATEASVKGKPASPAYVPGLMPALLNVAMLYSLRRDIRRVLIGACENTADTTVSSVPRPDQCKEFYQVYNDLLTTLVAESPAPTLQTPLIDLSYVDIVRLGQRFVVSMHQTWSCLRGGNKPCGQCFGCRQRAMGFTQAGLTDAPPPIFRKG